MEKRRSRYWKKRLAAVLLSLCMAFGLAAGTEMVTAYAADDYPGEYKSYALDAVVDKWNFYNRECTSFVAWCLNSRNGVGFTNQYGGVPRWGHAKDWGNVARRCGIAVDMNPAKGSVWWSANGTYGHVAWVSSVEGRNVHIEEYNWNNPGGYGERTVPINSASGYIHIKDIQEAPTAPAVPSGSYMQTGGDRTISDGDYHIVSALTGDRFNPGQKCLAIEGLPQKRNTNGANAELWGVLGNADHVFTVTWLGNGFYKIKVKNSYNKCLDVSGGDTVRGTSVQQWEDNGASAQQWVIRERSDGIGYTLQARCSGYYLDVEGGNTADGTNIRMWEGNDSMAQRWYFVPWGGGSSAKQEIPNGEYHIVPQPAANMTLNAAGDGTTDETNIIIWPSLQDKRHTFYVNWLGNGYYELVNSNSNLALDVSRGLSQKGANVQLYRRLDENNKKWLIKPCGDGSFHIISKCNGLYLDLYSGSTAKGTNVHLWVGHGTPTQKWIFIPYTKKTDAESVRLDKTSLTLEAGAQATLTATVSPANAANQTLTWSSNNTAVAAVNSSGVVTARSAGSATITVRTSNGKTAACKVTVKKKTSGKTEAKSVRLDKTSLTLEAGAQATLTATVSPVNAAGQTLTWKSDNTAVATVNSNGVVTARSEGSAKITVRTSNGKSATCLVVVKAQTDDGKNDEQTNDEKDDDQTNDEQTDCRHSYRKTVTPATMEEDGSIVEECRKCGAEKSSTVIPAIDAIILSKKSFTYNGREQEPEVTVEDNEGNVLTEGEDYTVSIDGNTKKVGRYAVVVEFEGNYEGEEEQTFDIIPKGTVITKLAADEDGFFVSWRKRTSQTTGYEIAYSTSPRFTKASTKTVTVKKNKVTSEAVRNLKAGKKYYVRIRTYKTVRFDGETVKIYSGWSGKRTVVTKK